MPGTRLSGSPIWAVQERFFVEQGIEAWRTAGTPSLVSTNAHVARVYAEAILAWAADLAGDIDRAQPLHIVEFGSGTGRLGFLILRSLERLRPYWPELEGVRLRYLMTDITEKTLDFWNRHPPLAPFLQDGRLDFALWTHRQGADLTPVRSGRKLGGGNPIALVANYVFDSLPQDAFHVIDGVPHEARVSLSGESADLAEARDGCDLRGLRLEFEDFRIPAGYYGDPDLDGVLETYLRMLENGSVLLPVAAIRALREFEALSDGRLLLLASDKGEGEASSFEGVWNWPLALHGGCFSFMANLHAVGLYFERRGGLALQSPDPRDFFRFCACALGGSGFTALRRTVENTLRGFSFQDLFAFCRNSEAPESDLRRALAIAKLADYDPYVFAEVATAIEEGLGNLQKPDRAAILMLLRHVSENDYQLGDWLDLPFLLGRLFYRAGAIDEAHAYYEASLLASGEHEATLCNIGLCWECKGEPDRAIACYRRCLELCPGHQLGLARLEILLASDRQGAEEPRAPQAAGSLP